MVLRSPLLLLLLRMTLPFLFLLQLYCLDHVRNANNGNTHFLCAAPAEDCSKLHCHAPTVTVTIVMLESSQEWQQ